MVRFVLVATVGETSIETKPSLPLVLSYTGRKMSAADWMSSTMSSQSISAGFFLALTRRTIASS